MTSLQTFTELHTPKSESHQHTKTFFSNFPQLKLWHLFIYELSKPEQC